MRKKVNQILFYDVNSLYPSYENNLKEMNIDFDEENIDFDEGNQIINMKKLKEYKEKKVK